VKHLTFNDAHKLFKLARVQGFPVERPPVPFAGRTSPTRVAWSITRGTNYVLKTVNTAANSFEEPVLKRAWVPTKFVTHTYCGKPNRYRALEAISIMRQKGFQDCWQVEFDRAGVLAWNYIRGPQKSGGFARAYEAFHPQAGGLNIIADFAKPTYVKRIGRMSVYSHAKRLSVEKLDAFYAWYERTFGRKLKRPRQAPMEQVSGVEAEL
jgi:hypothetical protein